MASENGKEEKGGTGMGKCTSRRSTSALWKETCSHGAMNELIRHIVLTALKS